MIPTYLQKFLNSSLTLQQKITTVALFMDPKDYPAKKIDPSHIPLGYEIRELLISNKITYHGFDSDGIIKLKKTTKGWF
tara:strand:+ start:403 stop:639 length:237 start_codon:yes stop_codon:yes gene_type:complete